MAIAFVANRGNGGITAYPATLPLTTAGTIAVGNTLILVVANDNAIDTGIYPTISDPRGNTWNQRVAVTNDPGIANAGMSLSIHTCYVQNPYTNGDVLGISYSTPPRAAWRIEEFSGLADAPPAVTNTNIGSGSSGNVTITPTAAGQLVHGGYGAETNNTLIGDADSTDGTWATAKTQVSNSGTASTSVSQIAQYKIVTGTALQTWNITNSGGDHAAGIMVLDEYVAPTASGNFFLVF